MSDIQQQIKEHDGAQFLDLLDQFPDQIQNSWEIGDRINLPETEPDSVLVCGMGGSGISGDLLKQFSVDRSSVPIVSNRFYRVPGWVDENSLVILVSYSGNTEETLASYREARERGATCVAVTSNGELEELARNDGHTVINVPPELPPRCAAGYLFVPLLFVLDNVGLADRPTRDAYEEACRECLDLTEQFSPEKDDNRALSIARRLQGKIPIVYGSQEHTGVLARRFKNQLNENAKNFAVYNEIPELHHNEIMSWDDLSQNPDRYSIVFLRDRAEHDRVQRRYKITRDILDDSVERIEEIQSRGDSRFARYMSLMLYTDYVSYYLAILRGKDPVSIGPIEQLKQQL